MRSKVDSSTIAERGGSAGSNDRGGRSDIGALEKNRSARINVHGAAVAAGGRVDGCKPTIGIDTRQIPGRTNHHATVGYIESQTATIAWIVIAKVRISIGPVRKKKWQGWASADQIGSG